MSQSSILGGEHAPSQARGRDAGALGPSDSSDSGSDIQGGGWPGGTLDEDGLAVAGVPVAREADSDAAGTGERASATPDGVTDAADIVPDRVLGAGADALDAADTVPLDADLLDPAELADEADAAELDEEGGDATGMEESSRGE